MAQSAMSAMIGFGLVFSAVAQTTVASAAAERLPPTLLPAGYFSTLRSHVVDQQGRPVRLACVGLNQPNFTVSMAKQMQAVVASGFNCLRMSWVDATMQEDLAKIDKVAAVAGPLGLRLILDHHTNEAGTRADGYGAQQMNGLWFDSGPGSDGTNGAGVQGTVTDAKWVANWVTVARRYKGNTTVIGFDLDNEPLERPGAATWGGGGPRDIHAAYTRAGNAIQAVNSDALIICEGPVLWAPLYGQDLTHVASHPVILDVANKVVYSAHLYPAAIGGAPYDHGPRYIQALNTAFGYLITQDIAPVWIGEMGASLDGGGESAKAGVVADEQAWAATVVAYLNGRAPGGLTIPPEGQGLGTDWWAWGCLEGQEPDGTLEKDWMTPRPAQAAVYSHFAQAPVTVQKMDPHKSAYSHVPSGDGRRDDATTRLVR